MRKPPPRAGGSRIASASVSAPHMPQPVRPVRLRCRVRSAANRSAVIAISISRASSTDLSSTERISEGAATSASLSVNPTARSSRSAGVASMTTCGTPRYLKATGRSSATSSVAASSDPACQRCTRTDTTGEGVAPVSRTDGGSDTATALRPDRGAADGCRARGRPCGAQARIESHGEPHRAGSGTGAASKDPSAPVVRPATRARRVGTVSRAHPLAVRGGRTPAAGSG